MRNTILLVGVANITLVFLLGIGAYLVAQRNSDNQTRNECVAHISARFFGHLADALSKEPASVQRQEFLDQMKADAGQLNHLDSRC